MRRAIIALAISYAMLIGLAQVASAAPRVALPSKAVSRQELAQMRSTSIQTIMREARALPMPVQQGNVLHGGRTEGPNGPEIRIKGVQPQASSSPASTTIPAATAATTQNGLWPGSYAQNPNRQVGKLYYDTKPGPGEVWNVCSGTAINSENKSVVLTAGHCAYQNNPDGDWYVQGNGFWYENFQFCPGYEYGCKLGVWYYRQVATTNSWFYGTGSQAQYDWRDDVAVLLVSPNPTKGYLVNAVGGQGITFNTTTGLYRSAFGYPAPDWRYSYSYNGEDLVYCQATDQYDAGQIHIPCTMTGGASGGPWIISPNSGWSGYVNSVNSHKSWGAAWMGGPYFDTTESNLFQYWRAR
jgi:hypothetical protein